MSRMFRRTLLGLFLLVAAAIPASAQFNGCVAGFCSSSSQWVFPGATLDLDFANNRYFGVANGINSLTTTRASTGYAQALNGTWVNFGNNIARRTDRGLLVEESRTNSIRNNSMQGVVSGSPGTMPTNWVSSFTTTGITQTLGTVTTINNVDVLPITVSGTSVGAVPTILFDSITQQAASPGQVWTASIFYSFFSGSLTNVSTFDIALREYDSGGAFLRQTLTSLPFTSTFGRIATPAVTLGASTAYVQAGLRVTFAAGAIAFGVNFGWPQLELGAFATSPIRTTSAAATRDADNVSLPIGSWYNASAGTFYAEGNVAATVGLVRRLAQWQDLTNVNRAILGVNTATVSRALFQQSGIIQADITGTIVAQSTFKIAATGTTNDFIAATNGVLGTADTSGTYPTDIGTLRIGGESSTSPASTQANGYIRRVAYMPFRTSNATLQSLTQ